MKKLFLLVMLFILAITFFSCSSNNEIYCENCDSQIYVDENAGEIEDDSENSHSIDMYTCKDCAYGEGYMDGYNKCLRELAENKHYLDEITSIYDVPNNDWE